MVSPSDDQFDDQYRTVPEADLQGVVRTRFDCPEPTQEQLKRREKQTQQIQRLGLPYLESLPVTEDSAAIVPRTVDEIANRTIAVCLTAVKGEGLEQNLVEASVNELKIEAVLTPAERAFIFDRTPSERDRIKFCWRYECLDVLLWALGYKDQLPPPNQICDVPTDVGIVWEQKDKLAANSQLRSMQEVLDLADYYYRLHWAAIELRLRNQASPYINEEIIMERHYALNWLIRYMDQEWDDIQTDT